MPRDAGGAGASGGWKPGRCELATERCRTCGRQIVEDMPLLVLERCHDGHHRFDKARPLWAVGPKASLAPEDAGPDRCLCGVLRGVHPLMAYERPQGPAPLEDLPTGAFGLGNTTGLADLQQPLHLLADRLHGGSEAGRRQCLVPDVVPPLQHLAGLPSQGHADLGRAPPPHHHRFEVPPQVRPTQLAAPWGVPAIRTPAIRHQPPPGPIPQEFLGDLAAARPPHHLDRHPGGDGRPQPGALAPFAPSRFVQVGHRQGVHRGPRLGHWLGYRLGGRLFQVRDGAQPQLDPQEIVQQVLRGAFRQVIAPRTQRRDDVQAGAKPAGRHPGRPLRPGGRPTGGSDQPVRLVFGDLRPLGLRILSARGAGSGGSAPA